MSTATLFGPKPHPHGVAFEIEARTDRDDWGPLEVKWRGFSQDVFNEEAWTFEWQSRADRLTTQACSAGKNFLPPEEALKDLELREFVDEILNAYRDRVAAHQEPRESGRLADGLRIGRKLAGVAVHG
jgi:hypothetical protein